jgi:hypothetical protein
MLKKLGLRYMKDERTEQID